MKLEERKNKILETKKESMLSGKGRRQEIGRLGVCFGVHANAAPQSASPKSLPETQQQQRQLQ